MNIRYEVATWVNGEPRLSYKSGLNWKTWGRRRAYDLALHLIREYEDQGVTDYEIGVYSRGGGLVWAWNACQAREAYARGEPYIGIPLGEMQREWDTLPRRERLRQRLAWTREYGLTAWSRFALGGVYVFVAFLFIGGPIIKFLVPGGSDWLHRNVDTVMLLCLAPLVLGLALYFVGGWVALPFWLGRGLWRRLRGYESEKAETSQSREAAISRGVVEHRLGIDDFEEAKESLAEGKYVVFDVDESAERATEEENREDCDSSAACHTTRDGKHDIAELDSEVRACGAWRPPRTSRRR
jgi:hypothetical protein